MPRARSAAVLFIAAPPALLPCAGLVLQPEQIVRRNLEPAGDLRHRLEVGLRPAPLPVADAAVRRVEQARQLFLAHSLFRAQLSEPLDEDLHASILGNFPKFYLTLGKIPNILLDENKRGGETGGTAERAVMRAGTAASGSA